MHQASFRAGLSQVRLVLGLDLQGGSHVLLEVDSGAVVKTQINSLRDDMRRVLRDEKVALAGGIGFAPWRYR